MAGRGTDIKLGGNPEFRARKRAGTNATEEQFAEALKIEKENWKKDYEEVKNAGGLYVIGTERHESRRIDNQLRGRSGRQGDPGRSKFYISMDDDLMRLFGGEKMKVMMSRIGMQPGEPIDHPWLNKGIEKAQSKVEDRNFEIRKHLLDYDDVLNEQRGVIYEQRDSLLSDENLSTRVMENAKTYVEDLFDEFGSSNKRSKDNSALYELTEKIRDTFGFQLPAEELTKEKVIATLQNDITEKETLAGKENLNMFIRYQYIQIIDKKWLDQLEALEGLREAVGLRSYGSKNPLTEYKIDGFNIFYDMLDTIRTSVMSRVFKVKIQLSPEAMERRKQALAQNQNNMNAQHSEFNAQAANVEAQKSAMSSFNGDQARRQATNSAMNQRSQGESITVRRTMPKVGRNEPCPCGSGKKYKQCHGR
jgi:preprotein translocase subunit SecA